jgi:hypothetical protein
MKKKVFKNILSLSLSLSHANFKRDMGELFPRAYQVIAKRDRSCKRISFSMLAEQTVKIGNSKFRYIRCKVPR